MKKTYLPLIRPVLPDLLPRGVPTAHPPPAVNFLLLPSLLLLFLLLVGPLDTQTTENPIPQLIVFLLSFPVDPEGLTTLVVVAEARWMIIPPEHREPGKWLYHWQSPFRAHPLHSGPGRCWPPSDNETVALSQLVRETEDGLQSMQPTLEFTHALLRDIGAWRQHDLSIDARGLHHDARYAF